MSPQTVRIDSEDATFQLLESLGRNRNQRHRHQLFPVEGVRQINQALRFGWTVRGFVYPYGQSLSEWASDVLGSTVTRENYQLPGKLHARLSRKNEASELIALVEMAADDLNRIETGELPLVVVVDRSNSPGNLGTIIRSCDALGVDGLILTGHSVDLYDPETVAASVGSIFSLPVIRLPSGRELEPLCDRLRAQHGDLQLIGTSAKAERQVFECGFWRPTLLLIGNETDGLNHAYTELADEMVAIPMQGSASSLNVACAASILLYEVQRQRNRGG